MTRPWCAFLLTILALAILFVQTAVAQDFSPERSDEDAPSSVVNPQSDQPPDLTPYDTSLPSQFEEEAAAPLPRGVAVIDVVVSNTDATLRKGKNFIRSNGEPSIAVGPINCGTVKALGCVAITAFSADPDKTWDNANAPIWISKNNGGMWTLLPQAIPAPPGVAAKFLKGCPCDQTIEFERFYLAGSFLVSNGPGTGNVYSGSSSNLESNAVWQWEQTVRGTADTTNRVAGGADQPWLLQGQRPLGKNVLDPFFLYSAYQRVGGKEQVAVTDRGDPPLFAKFNRDTQAGTSGGSVNSGLRIATDHKVNDNQLGFNYVYAVYEQDTGLNDAETAYKVQYYLNRTGDMGKTWKLEGDLTVKGGTCSVTSKVSTKGCLIAAADSTQSCNKAGCTAPNTFKFGGVNALIGGVDSVAIDPVGGDIYVVYGKRADDGNNRLFLAHLKPQLPERGMPEGIARVQPDTDVTGAANTALPAVSVTPDRTVGVFYYSFEGLNGDGFPTFSAHLKRSFDKGVTFSDLVLLDKFASPAKDIADSPKQRVYGDYVQLKTRDSNFYGTFTANRTKFCTLAQGCTESTDDPIFYYVPSKAE